MTEIFEQKAKLMSLVMKISDLKNILCCYRNDANYFQFLAVLFYRLKCNLILGQENDDDFYATVKEKDKKQREKKKEVQQRILNGDFLSNIYERKSFLMSLQNIFC